MLLHLAEKKREKDLKSIIALFVTATIWGFAFVAQRQGMESLDPFVFNFLRFSLGAAFILVYKRKISKRAYPFSLGLVLFAGASLQQIGLIHSTAGNAGFITGLYVVFVPLLGLLRKQKLSRTTILALITAIIGLYLINEQQSIEVTFSNILILIGAIFWALHVQLVDKYIKDYDTFDLAFYQFAVCAGLSFLCGIGYNALFRLDLITTGDIFTKISEVIYPLLFSGIISVGIAYTLQVYAQRKVEPAKTAVILCLESVFALIGGVWLLNEGLTAKGIMGALFLLTAMFISINSISKKKKKLA